jgi:excisionase family DNA binding protein
MEDLLTSKQVQDLLKIERITVYRMLTDCRLQGIKIGKQWRFPASQFENFLSTDKTNNQDTPSGSIPPLPIHCMQTIQNLFSDLSQIGTVITDMNGEPLTELSNCCQFCQHMLASPAGQKACQASWKSMAQSRERKGWMKCHAGLTYFFYALLDNGTPTAYLLAGQSRINQDNLSFESTQRLSAMLQVDEPDLNRYLDEINYLNADGQVQIERWVEKATIALEGILAERAGLIQKLQQIAEISQMGL